MVTSPHKPTKVHHDLATPYTTLLGVISALGDEDDIPHAERQQLFGILTAETQTCWGIAQDLLTLVENHEQSDVSWFDNGVSATHLTAKIRTEVLPRRTVANGLTLTISEPTSEDRITGSATTWLSIAAKLIDHALVHAIVPGNIVFAATKESVHIAYPEEHCTEDALQLRLRRLPVRGERRHFNAELGMGLFLVSKLADLHNLSVCTEVHEGIHTIRVSNGSGR